jgi:hypothetical protein
MMSTYLLLVCLANLGDVNQRVGVVDQNAEVGHLVMARQEPRAAHVGARRQRVHAEKEG